MCWQMLFLGLMPRINLSLTGSSHFGGGKFSLGGGVLRTEVLYCLIIFIYIMVY